MAKRNWYETIDDRVPAKRDYDDFWPSLGKGLARALFTDDHFGVTPMKSLFDELGVVGFQDKKDHYEMVTELGGNGDVKGDNVKIELLHESKDTPAYVKVTYEHKTETEHSSYSHSQTTSVTLPDDADEETVSAHFDEDNKVVVTAKKKVVEQKKNVRTIPIITK